MGFFDWWKPKPKPPAVPLPREMHLSVWGNGGLVADKVTYAVLVPEPTNVPLEVVPYLDHGSPRLKCRLPAHVAYGWGAHLTIDVPGFQSYKARVAIVPDLDIALVSELQVVARGGIVRLSGRGVCDDDGPFLGLGASLMWLPWGYANDRDRLAGPLNLGGLKGKTDYVRSFGVVAFPNRTTRASDLTVDRIAAITDWTHEVSGNRVHWTIFGGVGTGEEANMAVLRSALVDRFIAALTPRQHRVFAVDVANEPYSTGWQHMPGSGVPELQEYARRLKAALQVPVGLGAPEPAGLPGTAAKWYTGLGPEISVPAHLDRNITGEGGVWRPIRQARDGQSLGRTWWHDEPMGPGSSVNQELDPLRLVMGAVVTWQCQGFAYTFHSGAGIRGGEDASHPELDRKANLFDQPSFGPALDGMLKSRTHLPVDLPNWSWANGNPSYPHYPFDQNLVGRVSGAGSGAAQTVLRTFASTAPDRRVVLVAIQITGDVPLAPKWPMHLDVYEPLSGNVLDARAVSVGQVYVLPRGGGGVFLVGRPL